MQDIRPKPIASKTYVVRIAIFYDVASSLPLGCLIRSLDFLFFFAYSVVVPSTCRVSFTDGADITHTVTIAASSLYEAAALAVAEFKRSGFALASVGPATRLTIYVDPPASKHELTVARLQAWLDAGSRTPREQAVKVRMRQVLGRP